MKKVAVPVLSGQFSTHFGGCEGFAVYEIDESSQSVSAPSVLATPAHVQGAFPGFLAREGVHVVIAGGMGPRAVQIFEANGIEVVLGVTGRDPDALVAQYLQGTLVATGESCHDQGHDHGHGHGDGHGGHCDH